MLTNNFKILLADDNDEDRKLLAEYLHQQNYQLFLAPDGKVALDIAQKVEPDLILLDINMPVLDGYSTLQYMRTIPELEYTPVIFITAAVTPEERVKGLKHGAIDYIVKPYDAEEVLLRIQVHLRGQNIKKPSRINAAASSYKTRLDQALFNAAKAKMQADLSQTPNLGELAQELRTNTKRLNAAFKACCDMTPFEYLRDERMDEARHLLENSLFSIAAIAAKVGFKSAANFSTAFKEKFGQPPSYYRKPDA